ncbi:MAG TPA: hypothetical protein VJ763_08965 [Sphingomicrobium sp.]|nr:hypothetical protein [Sphingomicrobium sp.]
MGSHRSNSDIPVRPLGGVVRSALEDPLTNACRRSLVGGLCALRALRTVSPLFGLLGLLPGYGAVGPAFRLLPADTLGPVFRAL